MKIEVVLTEAEIVQELTEAVEARDLPEKFFYWSPLAVRAWLARAADPAIRRSAPGLAAARRQSRLAARTLRPAHSRHQFRRGRRRHRPPAARRHPAGRPRAEDIIRWMPARRCSKWPAPAPRIWTSRPPASRRISPAPCTWCSPSDAAESPKLLLMSGNTLGGFDPLDQMQHMAQMPARRRPADPGRGDLRRKAPRRTATRCANLPSLRWPRWAFRPDDGEVRFEDKPTRASPACT